MLAALALVTALVQPGNTLSGIAASHGTSLAAVEAANPQIADPNLISVGETVNIPSGGSQSAPETSPAPSPARAYRAQSSDAPSSSGSSGGGLADIPGVPSSFAACVAYRESTDLQNPAARGNAYGIIPSSGYNGYAMSLSQQKETFSKLYAEYGGKPWAADGCPGT